MRTQKQSAALKEINKINRELLEFTHHHKMMWIWLIPVVACAVVIWFVPPPWKLAVLISQLAALFFWGRHALWLWRWIRE